MRTNNVDKKIDEQIKSLLDCEKEVYDDNKEEVIIDRKYAYDDGDTKKVNKLDEIVEDHQEESLEDTIKNDIEKVSYDAKGDVQVTKSTEEEDESIFDEVLLLVVIGFILFIFVFLFLFFS